MNDIEKIKQALVDLNNLSGSQAADKWQYIAEIALQNYGEEMEIMGNNPKNSIQDLSEGIENCF